MRNKSSQDGFKSSIGHAGSLSNRLALGAIGFYRKFISPYKRFHCAHAVMGYPSCSTQAQQLFRNHTAWEATKKEIAYLRSCDEMAKIFNVASGNDLAAAAQQLQDTFGKSPEEAQELITRAQAYLNGEFGGEHNNEKPSGHRPQ